MSNVFWWTTVIVACVAIFLFAVVPSLRAPTPPQRSPTQQAPKLHDVTSSGKAADSLATYYEPARDAIPIDYPRRPVGACPYSKPPSTDLPLADIPLCLSQRSPDMRLGQ